MKTNVHLFIILRMRSVSGESCTGNQNTFYALPFFDYRAVYENVEKNCMLDRPQKTVWRMRIACWIPKATNTYSEYVILIAFPLQEWLH